MKKVCSLLLLTIFLLPCNAQKLPDIDDSWKFWSDGPLTWSDFQPRHLPDGFNRYSELKWSIRVNSVTRQKVGNLRFDYCTVDLKADRLLSWYDPDRTDEWTLRYHQVEFDIAESIRRQYQSMINSGQPAPDIHDYASRMVDSRFEALEQESGFGRDTAVIAQYERRSRTELEYLSESGPRIPDTGGRTWGYFGFIGYERQMLEGPMSMSLGTLEGGYLGTDILYGDMVFNMSLSFFSNTALKTDNFHYDSRKNYKWRKGEEFHGGTMCLNVGYLTVDRQYWKIAPYAGAGLIYLDQKTGRTDSKDREISSEISGLRIQAGATADWRIRQWIRPGEVYETNLRFNVYGAYNHFSSIGDAWSLNIGLSAGIGGWNYKNKRP